MQEQESLAKMQELEERIKELEDHEAELSMKLEEAYMFVQVLEKEKQAVEADLREISDREIAFANENNKMVNTCS